ncbi:MAG: NIF family HAD-type phosphatase [bacterium]
MRPLALTPLLALATALATACAGTPPTPPPRAQDPALAPAALLGCEVVGPPATAPLATYSHAPVPCWANRYVDRIDENVRYLNLSALMAAEGITRLQAVETQNHYRDLMREDPARDRNEAFAAALARAKAGEFESRVDPQAMARAKFIVVFDLDETLYDQGTASAECHDVSFTYDSNGTQKTKYIKMAPGWQQAIRRIRELGGAVAIFSANLDDRTLMNLGHITLDGAPLTESEAIAGIMSNSHLTQQSTLEPPGAPDAPWKGQPVTEPSKDLRHFDESLDRVIIVDDNPLRLFQFRNVRVFQKLEAAEMCTAQDPDIRAAYEQAMPAIVTEIEDSLRWLESHPDATFARAWLPYSDLGQVAVRFLMDGRKWDTARAIEHVRNHPELVADDY